MIKQILDILKKRIGDKLFYGSITFKFQAGKIVQIKEERSYQPVKEQLQLNINRYWKNQAGSSHAKWGFSAFFIFPRRDASNNINRLGSVTVPAIARG